MDINIEQVRGFNEFTLINLSPGTIELGLAIY